MPTVTEYSCSISIHALREEGDPPGKVCKRREEIFLSTPSARRATRHSLMCAHRHHQISIHALREEGDIALYERIGAWIEFLSTPSARRATIGAWIEKRRM